jgi:hypothetical protein
VTPNIFGNSLLAATSQSGGSERWKYVFERFARFQDNLALTSAQVVDGSTKFRGVTSCLNAAYWGHNSETANAFFIGSWAKDTRIRPPRDIDMYFLLPADVYHRFESYSAGTNKQSALLQEVKSKLLAKYSSSIIKGDGPVVLVDFSSYCVEVVPAFLLSSSDRSYYVCDTKNGGKYMTTKPLDEVDAIDIADTSFNSNARRLIRMLKCWQDWCSVPIKSFYLELLAIKFLGQWSNNRMGFFWYDFMCRDFFEWMAKQANSFVFAPGTYELLWLGDAWKSRAESAYARSVKACEYEDVNDEGNAGDEWQKIFGTYIPKWS